VARRALLEYACHGPSEVRWYAMIVEPLKRAEGGLVISHIDVSRRRRAEEEVEREREELAHALRVATLGELATSLAHEINQSLAAIASNAQAAHRMLGAACACSSRRSTASGSASTSARSSRRSSPCCARTSSADPQPAHQSGGGDDG